MWYPLATWVVVLAPSAPRLKISLTMPAQFPAAAYVSVVKPGKLLRGLRLNNDGSSGTTLPPGFRVRYSDGDTEHLAHDSLAWGF